MTTSELGAVGSPIWVQVQAFFEHGLLILEDESAVQARPQRTIMHENWDPLVEPVHFEEGSLYVRVAPDIDGDAVTLQVYRFWEETDCSGWGVLIFDEVVCSTGDELAIFDSDFKFRVNVPSLHGRATKVLIDDLELPRHIRIFA